MDNKTILGVAVAVIISIGGSALFLNPASPSITVNPPDVTVNVPPGGAPVVNNQMPSNQTFGALAGPDIPSPYISWGGVQVYANKSSSLLTSTTTVCQIQSPVATSTLLEGSGIYLKVSSTTATQVKMFKATFPTGNTTFLAGASVGANASADIVATTTTDNFVFAPNSWLNFIMSGGTGTFSPTGSCSAKWVVL